MKYRYLRTSKAGKAILRIYKAIAVPFYKRTASLSRKIAAHEHKMLFLSEWCIDNPENFDHYIDQFYFWGKTNTSHWLERGVYNTLVLQKFDRPVLLELCCGEGFNTRHFYSNMADEILACDFDMDAIKEAKKKNRVKNISYEVLDIRQKLPKKVHGKYITNIIWDTAIEHFSEKEINSIMKNLKEILKEKKGILSGHTIRERKNGKSLEQHEYEFKDMEDLKRFFTPYFTNVTVFETIYEERHNLYFWASDGELPFSDSWKHWKHT